MPSRLTTLAALLFTVLLYGILAFAIFGCGKVETGDTDHWLDCIDGCSKPEPSVAPPKGDQGERGQDGNTVVGPEGVQGPTGKDGSSCSATAVTGGALIQCTNGTNSIILNGQDAPPTPLTFTEVIDPCGQQTTYDEVLFKTASGRFVAYFAGSGGFLTLLVNGTYVTTDGSNCYFTVNGSTITEEHN